MSDELRRIYRALERELRAAGPGSVSRAQKAAGVGKNYLRQLQLRLAAGEQRGFDLAVLLRVLELLEVDKEDFFADLFGGAPEPIDRLRGETARLGEPPEIVARVRLLLAGEEWRPPPQPSPLSMPVTVRKLDDHRFKDARKTLQLISGALEHVEAGLEPRWAALPLLAVWGSARRMVFDQPGALDQAQQALMAAYELAEPAGDSAALGDLLQRLAYVVADRGDREPALALTDLAILRHTTAGHRRGVGRSLVDRGLWLLYLGRPRQAIEALKAALEHLPDDEQRHRFSAFQNLGLCYQKIGKPEQARHYADLAEAAVDGLGDWLGGKLRWLQAALSIDLHELELAERYLGEVIAVFEPIQPVDSAVATTDLVRLQLRDGRPADAYESARKAVHLIGALKGNRIAAAAIEDLTCCAYAGRGLSVALVDRVARRIREGWERQKRRSRK